MRDLHRHSLPSSEQGRRAPLRWSGPRGAIPALCLPGFLGDARVFEPIGPLLAARRSTYALDLPPGPPRAAAAALDRALDALGLDAVHLLTGSYGGLVARCLRPGRLRSWVTVATLPDRDLMHPGVRLQARLLRALPAPLVEASYRRHLRRELPRDGVPADLAMRMSARGLDAALLRARLQGVLDWDLGPLPPCPTTWVLGDTDPQARWTVAEVLARCPDVTVSHVSGGHRPYASHPAPLAALLEPLWAR